MNQDALQLLQLILSGIALPLLGWVLREVIQLGKTSTAQEIWRESHDREIVALRARIMACETKITELNIQIAPLTKKPH